MTDFAKLTLDSETAGLAVAVDVMKDVQGEAAKTEAAVNDAMGGVGDSFQKAGRGAKGAAGGFDQATKATSGTNNALKASSMHTATLAAQFNDIGLMLASGQSPFMLAMQQGTQVSQVLNQMGSRGGALAALRAGFMSVINPVSLMTLGIIGFGAAAVQAFMNAENGAKSFEDATDATADAIKRLNDAVNVYSIEGIQKLEEKYGEVNAELLEFIDLQTQAAQINAVSRMAEQIAMVTDGFQTWARTTEQGLARAFGKSVEEVERLEYLLRRIQTARTYEEQVAAITAARQEAVRLAGGLENAEGEGEALLTKLIETEDAARQLSAAAPKASWLNAAIDGAQSLVDKLWEAVDAKSVLRDDAGNPTQFGEGSGARRRPKRAPALDSDYSAPSGGGGGGALDPFAGDLEALQESLMTQRQLVDEWYFEGLEILNDRRAQELLTKQEHADLLFAIDQEYALRKLQLDEATNNSEVEMRQRTVSLLASTFSALGQHSKAAAVAAVALNAAKSIKETIQHTAVAVMRAMAELGPIAGPPAAARIKAMGAAQIGLIAANAALSLGGSGRGGGSVSAIGTAPQTQEAALPTQTLNFTIENDSFGIGEGIIRQIATQLNEAARNGSNIRATVSV